MNAIDPRPLRVGDLAARTGLSVRTLHHYEEIGLLVPSQRTDAGHRLYVRADVERLQLIVSLRALGLPLAQIAAVLDGGAEQPIAVLRRHRARVSEEIEAASAVLQRLDALVAIAARGDHPSTEDFVQTLQALTMWHVDFFSDEEKKHISAQGAALGPEAIRAAESEWPTLIAAMQRAKDRGVDPASEELRPLVTRWGELVRMFTGGHAGIERKLGAAYREGQGAGFGLDAALTDYVAKARAALTP